MTSTAPKLQKGQVVELQVTSLAFGGKGVARLDDFVVFVRGAVPGDIVEARITKNKRRYGEARVERLVTASPDRVAARCSMFGRCGGCVWQDLDYRVQLEYKSRQVRESLEHLGGLSDFELRPILSMESPWRYRNRADFSIGTTGSGAVVGFRPPGRWDQVLPLTECHLLDPGIEAVRSSVETWLRDQDLPGWDPRAHEGFARHLLARSAQGGRELLVSLVTAEDDLPGADGLVERLRAAHPQLVGVSHAVNSGRAELSAGVPSTSLWGRPFLLERVAGLTLKVSLDAFFQTNTVMADRLYGLAVDTAVPTTEKGRPVVWDLCTGVGSLALAVAGRAEAVLGIEAFPEAIEDAHENARLNEIDNAHFLVGDVAKVLREIAEGHRELPAEVSRPDVVIVDPPRSGLSNKAVSRIGGLGVPRIVYVSCNPATLGPNVARFQEYGYVLEHVTPVDMFPHTPHVECVALLTRQDGWQPSPIDIDED